MLNFQYLMLHKLHFCVYYQKHLIHKNPGKSSGKIYNTNAVIRYEFFEGISAIKCSNGCINLCPSSFLPVL